MQLHNPKLFILTPPIKRLIAFFCLHGINGNMTTALSFKSLLFLLTKINQSALKLSDLYFLNNIYKFNFHL